MFLFCAQLFSLDHPLVSYGTCVFTGTDQSTQVYLRTEFSLDKQTTTILVSSNLPSHTFPTCFNHPREHTPVRRWAHPQVWMVAGLRQLPFVAQRIVAFAEGYEIDVCAFKRLDVLP